MRGAQRLGKMQGREIARREHQITLEKMQKQNKGLIQAMQHRGGQEIDARDQKIGLMQQAGTLLESRLGAAGKQLGARDQRIAAMQQAGELLETRVATGSKGIRDRNREIRALQEGMGREGAARRKS